jgi:hypothetical protein
MAVCYVVVWYRQRRGRGRVLGGTLLYKAAYSSIGGVRPTGSRRVEGGLDKRCHERPRADTLGCVHAGWRYVCFYVCMYVCLCLCVCACRHRSAAANSIAVAQPGTCSSPYATSQSAIHYRSTIRRQIAGVLGKHCQLGSLPSSPSLSRSYRVLG